MNNLEFSVFRFHFLYSSGNHISQAQIDRILKMGLHWKTIKTKMLIINIVHSLTVSNLCGLSLFFFFFLSCKRVQLFFFYAHLSLHFDQIVRILIEYNLTIFFFCCCMNEKKNTSLALIYLCSF